MPALSASSPQGRLARLSYDALRYAESLRLTDLSPLTARIYGYGREPVSPVWARRLAGRKELLAFLGAGEGADLRRTLDCTWDMANQRDSHGWVVWASRRRSDSQPEAPTYKLYVSPKIEAMPRAFAAVVDVFSSRGGSFKVGADAPGLLRPDKLVLYFLDQEGLLEVASKLTRELEGVSPHGVPFSAPITDDGLLSWGMDPPRSDRLLSWQEPESWRLWVVRRLAAAMIAARRDTQQDTSSIEFALERLRRQGVDVEGWTPSASIWQRA